MVSGRPSTCDEQPSEPKQKKQRLSAIRSNSEQAMKLVEAYTPHVQTMFLRDYF